MLSILIIYKNGALGGNRTHDPRLRKPVLYPTELRTHMCGAHHRKKTPTTPGFGNLYSIQLSYERAMHIITKK